MSQTILAVDVGNSRAKFGIMERTPQGFTMQDFAAISLRTRRDVAAQLTDWLGDRSVPTAIAAGSNPPVLQRLLDEWPTVLPTPRAIQSPREVPVKLAVDQPDAVGLDRALNALAAASLSPGQPVVIVDSGTTTTVDLVSGDGVFQGGTIFPGLRLSAYALHDYTAKLPMIDVDAERQVAPPLPGKNTEHAMRAGLYWGQLGAIREIVTRLSEGLGSVPRVLLTGGAREQLAPFLDNVQCVDSLPLLGLALLEATDA